MKDLDRFNELSKRFETLLTEKNADHIDENVETQVNKINQIYNEIQNKLNNFNKNYNHLNMTFTSLVDSYLQSLCYLLYFGKIKSFAQEYKNLSQFINMILGKNSKINFYLNKIDNLIILLKSQKTKQNEKEIIKNDLTKTLQEFKDYVIDLLIKLGLLDDTSEMSYKILYDIPSFQLNTNKLDIITSKIFINNTSKFSKIDYDFGDLNLSGENKIKTHIYSTFTRDISDSDQVEFKIKNNSDTELKLLIGLFKDSNTAQNETDLALDAQYKINDLSSTLNDKHFGQIVIPSKSEALIQILYPENKGNAECLAISHEDKSGSYQISEIHFNNVNYPKKLSLTNKCNRNINSWGIPNSKFQAYVGSTNISSMNAQESHLYIRQNLKSNGLPESDLYITSPIAGYFNAKFLNKPKNIWFINLRDYMHYKFIINEEPNDDNKDYSVLTVSDSLRFSHIFSSDTIENKYTQSVKIKPAGGSEIRGKVFKGNIYNLTNFTISSKMKNKVSAESLNSKYPLKDHFSDEIFISEYYDSYSGSNIQSYIIKGNLQYDAKITEEQNEEINNNNKLLDDTKPSKFLTEKHKKMFYDKPGTFYKGTLKFYDKDGNELSSAENGISGNLANKEIICKVSYNEDNNTVDVKGYIENSNQNKMFNTEAKNSINDINVLPNYSANFEYTNLAITHETIFDSPEKQVMNSLLSIAMLDPNNFSESDYLQYIDLFKKLKDKLSLQLIKKLQLINNLVSTVIMLSSILPQYDLTYTKEYLENLTASFNYLVSDLNMYTTTNQYKVEELYNGVVYDKITKNINKISIEFQKFQDDLFEADDCYYQTIQKMNAMIDKKDLKVEPSLYSAVDTLNQILTLSLTSFSVMQISGDYSFVKLELKPYAEWNDYFNKIHVKDKNEFENEEKLVYFINETYKLILYISTQLYMNIKDLPLAKLTNILDYLNKYIKIILFRLLNENIKNKNYQDVFNSDIYNDYVNFDKIKDKYVINNINVNSDFINPYIIKLFSFTKKFNLYDLTEFIKNPVYEIDYIAKPLFYLSILNQSKISKINNNFLTAYKFLTNGQKLNIRELILLITMLLVYKELKEDEKIKNYIKSLDSYDIDKELKNYLNDLKIISHYYNNILNENVQYKDILNKANISATPNNITYAYNVRTIIKNKNMEVTSDQTQDNGQITIFTGTLCDILLDNIINKDASKEESMTKNITIIDGQEIVENPVEPDPAPPVEEKSSEV